MQRNLGIEELGDLLERPIVAILATYVRDSDALLSPVWHEWRGGGFNVLTGVDDVKVRHLRRDPRAGLVVFDQESPYRGIEVRGRHRLVMEGVVEARYRIAANPRVGVSCQATRAWLPRGLPHPPARLRCRRQRRRIMWDAAPSVRRLG